MTSRATWPGWRSPRGARRGTTTTTRFRCSYRHGLRRWQIDPSAGIIRLMEMTGLAWDVVRVSPERRDNKALVGAA